MTRVQSVTVAVMTWVMTMNAGVAAAQSGEEQLNRAVKRALLERAVAEPLTGTGQPAAEHQLTVLAEKGEVNGRARFFVPFGPSADGVLTFTGPLTNGATNFATDTGLAKGASVNGSLKLTFWTKVNPTDQISASPTRAVVLPGTAATTKKDLLDAIEQQRTAPAPAAAAVPRSASERTLRRLLDSPRLRASPERFYAALAQMDTTLIETRWAGSLTPGFEAARHVVDYLDGASFESATFDHTTKTFTLSGGVSKVTTAKQDGKDILTPLFYVGGSFRGGGAVDVEDPRDICRSLSSGVSECFTGPVGEPQTSEEISFAVESRVWTPGQTLGLNPRYTRARTKRDDLSEPKVVHTFDVPIYFMRQTKDLDVPEVPLGADLIGGVNLGWRKSGTDAGGGFVMVFLTKAFGLP